jgi:Putative Flp pilus-assembly TadE/G-like
MRVKGRTDERGQVTVFVIGVFVALVAVAGLVFDGGTILAAHRRADDEASGAARAAAQQVSASSLLGSGSVTLDPNRVQAAVDRYLAPTGHRGVAQVDGDRVSVTVTFRQPLQILGIVGIFSSAIHGRGAAHAVRGVTGPGS